MRFKKTCWLNMETMKPIYGIKIQRTVQGDFLNAMENGKPLFFDTEVERDAKIKEIKKNKHLSFEIVYPGEAVGQ